jgi:hypothetical protein
MRLIKELIRIPERVHQGDFVLKLSEGVSHAERTLRDYVVTPELARAFEQALGFVQSAVEGGQSKAAYLHGSFGAGKSHFMAVLHLLLQGNLTARALAELAAPVAKHAWIEGRRFLLVPYHMVGAVDMESAVLGGYAEHVRKLHPEAPTPGFYQAEGLFRDAQQLRTQMGDAAFFAALNQGAAADDGWGQWSGWTAQSFEAAMLEPPAAPERVRLVGELINTYFTAYRSHAGHAESFVGFDAGLAILSQHAAALGYDGVILFLDELVLWLASRAADVGFISREGTKLVKLVEATTAARPIPLISFIARQRDLRELVGEHLSGAAGVQFTDVLRHWEARFHTITLEDRNLPAIAQKRILQPLSEAARAELTQAFESTMKLPGGVVATLQTAEADRELFAKVYPFSPALVQTLIAVSGALQRERTALRLMMQLLVDRREDLQLGQLIPVGDLWDVIEAGDEPFSEAMRLHFENAKRLYRQKLLPLLARQHELDVEDVQRGTADPARLQLLRNSARLLKTLLLSALVPEVAALKALTPNRLAALNHGSVRTPIPGQEAGLVLRRLREWAGEVGEIKVGEDQNPVVSIQITGVDLEPILLAAETNDNDGNRRRLIREVLFNQLGLPEATGLFVQHRFDWRNTPRDVDVHYDNVRLLSDERLKGRADAWTLILDYPFDEGNRTPQDDIARVASYRGGTARTLVWLPSFLSLRAMKDLGRLVILDHILQGDRFEQYASNLSQIDRIQARALAANQRDSLRARLRSQLEVAYGISPEPRDAVGHRLEPDQQLRSLDPTFAPRPPVGANLAEALADLLDQMYAHQYPAHPKFETRIDPRLAKRLWQELQPAFESPDRRVQIVDSAARRLVRSVVPQLKLGSTSENVAVLDSRWVEHFQQRMARDQVQRPSVGQLRGWIDQPSPMGLPLELQDLLILCYAAMTNRHFTLRGGPASVEIGKLPDHVELAEQTLPAEAHWQSALKRAALLFGQVPPKVLNAANVGQLAGQLHADAQARRPALRELRDALRAQLAVFGIGSEAPRLATLASALQLLDSLLEREEVGRISALADAELHSSEAAVARVLGSVDELLKRVRNAPWSLFQSLKAIRDARAGRAQQVLTQLAEALRHDEHVQSLKDALARLEPQALEVLSSPGAEPAPVVVAPISGGSGSGVVPTVTGGGRQPEPEPALPVRPVTDTLIDSGERRDLSTEQALAELEQLKSRLEADREVQLTLSWQLQRRTPR